MKKKPLIALASVGFVAVSHATSVQVVDYNYDSASGTTPARGADTSTTSQITYKFDDSSLLFDGPNSGTNRSTDIYGAWNGQVSSGTLDPNLLLSSDGRIQLVAKQGNNGVTSYTATSQALVLWDQSDFLNGGTGQTLAFDTSADTSVSIDFRRLDGATRLVVRDDATYYISEVIISDKGVYSYAGTSGALTWALYNPTGNSGADFNDIPTIGYSAMTFSDVTAIGIYSDGSRTDAESRFVTQNQVQFNLAVIPESSAYSLLIGLTSLAFLARRRR